MNVNEFDSFLRVSFGELVNEQVNVVKLVKYSKFLDSVVESLVCLNSVVTVSNNCDK